MNSTVSTKASTQPRARGAGGDALGASLTDTLSDPILRKASGAPAIAAQGAFSAATQGQGSPVPYKGEMESSFGRDFSGVQAFTGRSKEAGAMGAEAATQGESIVFADAAPSRETVGHELGHVEQFRRGDVPRGEGPFGDPASGAEREAEAAGASAAEGGAVEVGGSAAAGIHRRPKPGAPTVDVPAIISLDDFKEKTYVMFASRGTNLEAIDNWLAALDRYTSMPDAAKFDNALSQCLDATQAWLSAHGDVAKQNRSVKARFPHVQALSDALATVKAGGTVTVQALPPANAVAGPPEANDDPTKAHVAKAVTETVPAGTGLIGGGADRHGETNEYGELAKSGKHDAVEGGFMAAGGVADIALGIDKFGQKGAYAKFQGATSVGSGLGKIGGGIAKSVAGASGGENKSAAAVSEGFGAGVAMLSVVTEGASFIKGSMDAAEDPGLTGDQKVAFVADRARNLIGMSKGVSDSVNAITKAATGAANAGAATASGVAGVATGSIDVLQGGYQVATALMDKSKLDDADKTMNTTLTRLKDEKTTAEEDRATELDLAATKRRSAAYKQRIRDRYDAIIADLQAQIDEIESRKAQFDSAIAAMNKVQDRRLKSGAFKMATGSLDVVSGALMLSGVGAPVAIALGALSALLKLGAVGLDVGRAWKSSKMTQIALRLADDGSVKGKPDEPDLVGYRTMEKRVRAAYYANYIEAMHDKTPPDGMSKDDWGHVRDFVHEEKLAQVKKEQKQVLTYSAAKGMGEADLKGKWGELQGSSGQVMDREYPTGSRRANLTFTFSAHKSKQAVEASNSELATALVSIGMGAFDPASKAFVDTPVVGVGGGAQTEGGASVQKAMADALLKNVGITADVWLKLWRGAEGHFAGDPDPANTATPFAAHKAPDMAKFTAFIKAKVDAT